MTSQSTGFLTEYLKIGSAVSLSPRSAEEQAAIIQSIAEDQLSLKFSRQTSSQAFQVGDPVLVKFWDEGATVYAWDAEVKELGDPEGGQVTLTITSREVNVQRRKSYRVRAQIPFEFLIVGAARSELIGQQVGDAKTDNISIGGLLFASQLPLGIGDKLQLRIQLEPTQTVDAVGWVVRHLQPEPGSDRPSQLALQFLHLEAEQQGRLLQFLKSYYA